MTTKKKAAAKPSASKPEETVEVAYTGSGTVVAAQVEFASGEPVSVPRSLAQSFRGPNWMIDGKPAVDAVEEPEEGQE